MQGLQGAGKKYSGPGLTLDFGNTSFLCMNTAEQLCLELRGLESEVQGLGVQGRSGLQGLGVPRLRFWGVWGFLLMGFGI